MFSLIKTYNLIFPEIINKKMIIYICLIFIINGIYGCNESADRIDQRETYKINKPVEKPLENALELLNLTKDDLTRPDYYESSYNLICRMPFIDIVSASAFSLHKWVDETSTKFVDEQNISSHDVLKIITDVLSGSSSSQWAHKKEQRTIDLLHAYIKLCYIHEGIADQKDLLKIKNAGFSEEFDKQLGQLVDTISEASLLTKKAFSLLSREEREYLLSMPERFFFTDGIHFNFLTAPVYEQEKISFITRKINFDKLYASADLTTLAVKNFAAFLKSKEDTSDPLIYFKDGKKHQGLVIRISSPIGDIVILGQGKNIIQGNAAILIDLGGNDEYIGDIANGSLMPGRISVVIDISGDDRYDNKMNQYSQGFGCMSVGLLEDLQGNDHYISGNMAQGCGIYGVGILEDLKGNDVYLMGMIGQGFGVFGTGILLDKNGNDRYLINGLGQGTGSTMGFGCLIDSNGNDKYIADSKKTRGKLIPDDLMNHVQGAGLSIRSADWPKQFSFYGGIGFLNDGKGDDFYYSNGGNCMGSSYFMSLGALVDHEGNDVYMPEKGYGIGSAVHLTNAVFIDRKGNDQYFGVFHSGGVGSDQSVGIMEDYEGNDIYGPNYDYLKKKIQNEMNESKEHIKKSDINNRINNNMADASYGAALKPKALGILIDYKGDDQYFSRKDGYGESCGGIIPPVDPDNWSHGILIDLDGNDYYSKRGMEDNHYVKYFNHGLCYDTNYQGNDIYIDSFNPAHLNSRIKENNSKNESLNGVRYNEIENLLKPNSFNQYSAIGKVIKKGTRTTPELIRILKESSDNKLNRTLIEILNIFIVQKQFEQKHINIFEELLKAKDPFVRGFAAHSFGVHKAKDSADSILQSINDENEKVRYNIIWALGQIDLPAAYDAIISSATNDPSLECRRMAIKALANFDRISKQAEFEQKIKIMDVLMESALDEDEDIRSNAALGLRQFSNENNTIDQLKKLLSDESFYVRRSSATSLIESGYKQGIPVLIDTLKYPSIDTFKFYDHDLIKKIAFYCGVDFSKEKRYLYSTWMNWWRKNGDTVDLDKNLSIMKDIQNAFFVKNESKGVEVFERLIKENPNNIVIKNRFVQFCYEWINYRLLTKENVTPSILERCIFLQKIISEIEPGEAGHKAKLANLYARSSKFYQAAKAIKSAMDIDPSNKNYVKTWNEYKKQARK